MTKFSKLFEAMRCIAVIALVAVIGFSFVACDDGSGGGDDNNGGTPTANYSLNGVWEAGNGMKITVSGSTGVYSALGSLNLLWTDAFNKNYIAVGKTFWQSLSSTGNLTWSGQELQISAYTSSPNVAIGTNWGNVTFTMSSNGQTITVAQASGGTGTLTRKR
jgi:hypothetical protein